MNNKCLLVGFAVTALLSTSASFPTHAHSAQDSCEVSLNYDVTVEPSKLVFSQSSKEAYRVEYGRLYIDGQEVALNDKQQELLSQYSDSVSKQVPEVIAVVNEAVAMATQAMDMALTPLLGEDTGTKLSGLIDGVTERLEDVAYQHGDQFYLGATEDSLEDAFNEEFEKEVEALVQSSIGSIMMSLGSSLMAEDGGDFEQKMAAFGDRMEAVGDEIEEQMELQTENLEKRAEDLCENFEQLLVIEERLRNEIPQLSPYPLAGKESYSDLM